MSWYYASGQQQYGPFTEEEWQQKLAQGLIQSDTLVWQDGMTDWKPFSSLSNANAGSPPPDSILCLCGQYVPKATTVQIGEQWVCPSCKDTAIQRLKEGVSNGSQLRYAGFWIRFAAKFIDSIILGVVNIFIQFIFIILPGMLGMATTSISDSSNLNPLGIVLLIISFVLQISSSIAYHVYFVGKKAATPGKMLCRLKIIRPDSQPLTYGRATGRFFAEIVSGITCYIGYIMAAFDEEKRSLHDRIADTRVIQI
ncbi:MAG: RDD family protein [Blastochloris sp.]|nr:RDD family protein [Blastochloris sp.]